MTEKLKGCPFCGGTAKLTDLKPYPESWVECTECGARTRLFSNSEESAVSDWNASQIEDKKIKYEPTSYSCRACKNATDKKVKHLREALEVILDAAQKDEPCILAIKTIAYTALKGDER